MKNKFVAIALVLTTCVWAFPASTFGATTEELQAQITALLQQITALQAQLSGATPSTTSACFTKTLKFGMTDAEVTALQNALKGDAAIYPEGLVTGYFGSLSQAAVQKFQAKYAIVSSGTPESTGYGLVGPKTRAQLNSLYCTTGTTVPTGTTAPTPVGGGVSVMLASDSPAAASVIYDTGNTTGAQALASFTKLVFTAGTTAAKITGVKLLRSGISTNSDINNVYLYDGNTKLAEMISITSDNMVNFSDTAGLFTVPAGTSKTVIVKADIANSASATGKTMRFGINAATDITVEAATASGTFPITGNYMTWAGITDLGQYTFANSTYPTAIDPSATVERELWRMTSTAQNQKISLQYMKFTMIGSAAHTDFKDFKLTVGAKVYGPVDMAADKTVTFDIGSDAYLYESGQTKMISLSAKVIGGATRTYYFAVQNRADIVVYDANYNVYLKPNKLDAYAIIKATAVTTINGGTLTISKSTDTPVGSIALNATSMTLAKFDFAAAGENIKVTGLAAKLTCSSSTTATVRNVKILVDGSQVGTTDSSVVCDAEAVAGISTLGNTFIITAGQTKVVSIVGDLTVASDIPHAGETITGSLVAVTDGYTKMTSGGTANTTTIAGNALTLRAGTVTVAKNISVPSGSATNPTVVTGASDARIGSFTITAGLGEAVDVTQFVVKDVVGDFPTYYTNLKVKDASGNQLGSTYGTLTAVAASTYSFVPTTAIRINAGQQSVFNIYADVVGGLTAGAAATTSIDAIYATGVSTSQTADDTSSDPTLQTVYVSAKGTLTVSVDAATPIAQQIVNGKTYEFARFKFAAGTPENVRITDIVVNLNSDEAANIAGLTEFKLYDVTGGAKTLVAGPVYSVVANATTAWDGYVSFTGFTDTVTKGTNKIYAVEAKVGAWQTGTSADTQQIIIASDYIATINDSSTSTPITAYGAQSNTQLLESDGSIIITGTNASANAMTIYRTKVAAAIASDSPSGASAPSGSHTIAKFTVSNEANEGSYSANVTGMSVTISATNLTESGAATGTRTFTLYKDSITTANKVAEAVLNYGTAAAGSYNGTIDFASTTASSATAALAAGWTNYTVATTSSTTFVSTEVAAGGSKTFILVADTTCPKASATVTTYLTPTLNASGAATGGTYYGLTWTDGEATGITTVDTLPFSSPKTLSW